MARKPKIGEYRHTPGNVWVAAPDGTTQASRVRRRFPYRGMVFMGYGLLGPLVCAGVTLLVRALGLAYLLPQRVSDVTVPPSPTLNNLLFGAGIHELVLACAVAGYWVWTQLWRLRLPSAGRDANFQDAFNGLLGRALTLGVSASFAVVPAGAFGLYLRTAPANQPMLARPFFGILASLVLSVNLLMVPIVLVTVTVLGLLLGVSAALGVAAAWQQFPEEPIPG
jgi:hypothetical protein